MCLFGDSHLACLKLALNEGLVDTDGWDIEFWGADGPRFRKLSLADGRIHARPGARDRVAQINRAGRRSIGPGDFDAVLFMGVRLRTLELFAPRLHRARQPGGHGSRAACIAEAVDWMTPKRCYRYAASFAASGQTRVLMAPATFPTQGIGPDPLTDWPMARLATAPDRAAIWADLVAVAADDGITLLPQPDRTVVDGVFTRPDHAVAGAADLGDAVHRNGVYGALLLGRVLAAAGDAAAPVCSESI